MQSRSQAIPTGWLAVHSRAMSEQRETTWADFYRATAGRPVRELFLRAIKLAGEQGDGRQAIDIGCGDGTETLALLAAGWDVRAIDSSSEGIEILRSRVSAEHRLRLETRVSAIDEAALPAADFIYAGLSLFFCSPAAFEIAWKNLRAALKPGGVIACHLLGPRDSWAGGNGITSHTIEQARALFDGLTLIGLDEIENDRPAVSGPKHWHLFEVIARRS